MTVTGPKCSEQMKGHKPANGAWKTGLSNERPRGNIRAATLVAAALGLLTGGLTGCGSSGSSEVIVADSPAAPEDAFSRADSRAAVSEGVSSGSALKWVEFDPLGVFGPNHAEINSIEPVGDGRVIARAFASGRHSALVSGDGSSWSEVPLPAALDRLDSIDIAGDRWLVAGRDQSGSKPVTRAFFSDDQGTDWAELDFRAGAGPRPRLLVAAMVSQERMVLAVKQDKLALTELIVARGFVHDEEEVIATSVEGTTLTFTVEGSSAPDSFELTGDESAMLSDPIGSRLLVFYSDGGSPELVADYPGGLHAYGYGAADGFRLFVVFGSPAGSEDDLLVFSPDGRHWSATTADFENYQIGENPEGLLWSTGGVGGQYRVERFDGVWGPDQVLPIPDGVSSVEALAVGPAGILALADPDTALDIAADSGELTEFDKAGKWIGWSKDGTNWQWQTVADAFNLTGLANGGIEVSDVDLAVGDDYAVALIKLIQTMDVQACESALPADSFERRAPAASAPTSTSTCEIPHPSRWFIAKAG